MLLLEGHFAEDRNVYPGEIPILIFESPYAGNHCGIVGRVAELRDINRPAIAFGVVMEGIAQTVVGGDATCDGHLPDARLPDRQPQFLHENVYDGMFQTGCNILLMMLDEVRIFP